MIIYLVFLLNQIFWLKSKRKEYSSYSRQVFCHGRQQKLRGSEIKISNKSNKKM